MGPVGTTPWTFPGTRGLQCVSGFVNLFQFITAPAPGSVIGEVTPLFGRPIPIVQSTPTPLGGVSLSSADRRFAILCGQFVVRQNQLVLDVVLVNPGAPSPTGTPFPFNILPFLGKFGKLGPFGPFSPFVPGGFGRQPGLPF